MAIIRYNKKNKLILCYHINNEINNLFVPKNYWTLQYNGQQVGALIRTRDEAEAILNFFNTLDREGVLATNKVNKTNNKTYNQHLRYKNK